MKQKLASAAAWVGIVFAAVSCFGIGFGIYSHRGEHAAYRARHERGVRAQASVIRSHYNSDGGDPGGWTSEVVLIPTPEGRVRAVVGHHNPEAAGTPKTVEVIYDPKNPTNAQTVEDYETYGDYSAGVGAATSIAIAVAFGSLGVATLIGGAMRLTGRRCARRRREVRRA